MFKRNSHSRLVNIVGSRQQRWYTYESTLSVYRYLFCMHNAGHTSFPHIAPSRYSGQNMRVSAFPAHYRLSKILKGIQIFSHSLSELEHYFWVSGLTLRLTLLNVFVWIKSSEENCCESEILQSGHIWIWIQHMILNPLRWRSVAYAIRHLFKPK